MGCVKLAEVGVERLGVIRYYFTTTSCLHGARHLLDVILACHDFVPTGFPSSEKYTRYTVVSSWSL